MVMHHNDNGYWLDSLFKIIQQQPAANDPKSFGGKHKQRTLEEQFNILSKLIVLSFFIFLTMHNIKTSLTITLSLLLIVSVSYYILDQMFEQRENFEEDDEIRPTSHRTMTNGRTSVNNIKLNYEMTDNRDIYLEKRPNIPVSIKYKELLPLHSFYERTTSTFQNPNLIEDIPYIEKPYGSNHWKSIGPLPQQGTKNNNPKKSLINNRAASSRYMIRSNVEHIAGDEVEFDQEQLFRQSHDSFLMNTLEQRQLYSDQLTKLNKSRGAEQQLTAPINRNIMRSSVGRIGGGSSGAASYFGPRG